MFERAADESGGMAVRAPGLAFRVKDSEFGVRVHNSEIRIRVQGQWFEL